MERQTTRWEILNKTCVLGRKFTARDLDANGMVSARAITAKCGPAVLRQVCQGRHSDVFRAVPERAEFRQTMEVPQTIRVEIAPARKKKSKKRGGR